MSIKLRGKINIIKAKLTNHWLMFNLSDVVGGNDLQAEADTNYGFTSDRFCCLNSAIRLSTTYLRATPGVYFSGDFTLMAWIQLKSFQSNARLLEFSNGPGVDQIAFGMDLTGSRLVAAVTSNESTSCVAAPSLSIELNRWYHVTLTLDGQIGHIYVNGILNASGYLNPPADVIRTNNFVGKNSDANLNIDVAISELKIFSDSLTSEEIFNDFRVSLRNLSIGNLFDPNQIKSIN